MPHSSLSFGCGSPSVSPNPALQSPVQVPLMLKLPLLLGHRIPLGLVSARTENHIFLSVPKYWKMLGVLPSDIPSYSVLASLQVRFRAWEGQDILPYPGLHGSPVEMWIAKGYFFSLSCIGTSLTAISQTLPHRLPTYLLFPNI